MSSQTVINRLNHLLISLGLMLLVFYLNPAISFAQTDPAELSKAVQEIEFLNAMRSGLASTLEGKSEEPTLQTMKEVCRPVGTRVMELSQENGWQVKQIASKYRNPAHAQDDLHARITLAKFQQDPELSSFWNSRAAQQPNRNTVLPSH